MSIFTKIFGTHSERALRKIRPIVDKIESLGEKYKAMSDEELRAMTPALKERLQNGETLDDILPDAFAIVREADDRILGKRPFRVQLIGGIVLHMGRIAEMKTGEGKTLVATLPAYLNALTGEGVHIVTVNEYLARTGFDEMSRVYGFLGLTTGLILNGQTGEEKKKQYACDITYGTDNEFGFDYLRDNMVQEKDYLTQRGFVYAIVDEVDSILIDEARTPLIISGQGEKTTDLYDRANDLVRKFEYLKVKKVNDNQQIDDVTEDSTSQPIDRITAAVNNIMGNKEEEKNPEDLKYDYIVDEKARTATLTARGIMKAEKYFGLENYSDPENSEIAHHISKAIYAWGVMRRDVDYVVKDNQVLIVDSFTGRIMPGRKFSDGLHQAIDAKENVEIEKESLTVATITLQNYFRMYRKLSGMTGTALTESEEFEEIYNLDVVEIPTNEPMIRIDHNDVIYKTDNAKYKAIIQQIEECRAKEQPVLVGTVSVEKSEYLSALLKKKGIPHTVLNAKYHEKEAEIVAMAGKAGTVTIATNMAGRGTDIMLGGNPEFLAKRQMKHDGYEDEIIGLAVGTSLSVSDEVLEARKVYKELFSKYKEAIRPEADKVRAAGGLFIIGTERHESRRIDNQLRGRSGRQGDPGESRFFISLQDDIMRLFGEDRIYSISDRLGMPEDQAIDLKIMSNTIERAQKKCESANFARRRTVLEYDDVMNQQRNLIYSERRKVLEGLDVSNEIRNMITEIIDGLVARFLVGEKNDWNIEGLCEDSIIKIVTGADGYSAIKDMISTKNANESDISEFLKQKAFEHYEKQRNLFDDFCTKMNLDDCSFDDIQRNALITSVDKMWVEHIDAMDDLRGSIGLNAYAQRKPIVEYKIVGGEMFDEMIASIREETVRTILSANTKVRIVRRSAAKITGTSGGAAQASTEKSKPVVRKKSERISPNDPCPCGSGKKYKKCCGLSVGGDK